jgi:hypothetical protein
VEKTHSALSCVDISIMSNSYYNMANLRGFRLAIERLGLKPTRRVIICDVCLSKDNTSAIYNDVCKDCRRTLALFLHCSVD